MYHLDLGLYHYQIEFTKGILGRSSIDKMNERIGAIPRYPGLKIFSKGLQSIARLTTSEHRDLMKVIVFVVDGLLSNDLSEVYVKWNKMYILNRLEIFKESDLEKFQKAINEWADLFVILFRKKSDSKMKFPKFHSWIFHIVDTIREYGAINGYTTETYEREKSYAEQNSGNWWKYAEASILSSAYATTTDTLGKSSLHPIYISLGNIPTWRKNKEDAKQLLGYFPILFAKNEKEKTSPEFKKLVRETFHKSLKFLLDPLFENENGIDYKINNRIIWFFLKISTIIGDWPEACTYSLTYKSASSNFPCHFCLVQKNDLIDTMQDQIILPINGYTTETYESLHKSYVKTPYRLSNKKGIEEQIMKTIRRKAIIKRRVTEELHKTPTALIYTSKLFEFKLLEASIFFEQQKKNPDLTENMIKGFAKFLECLDLFFDMLDIISAEDCRIKIFGSVTLKNINILRATNKFQNRPWFREKSYAEQNSGNWWKYAEASILSSAYATTTDTLGKSSLHPIYISLGNIPTWRKNKEDAKQLLGYFPILFAKNEKEKTSPEFKKLVRETFHKSLKFLLDPLFENENGIDYKINNRIIWFFLKISTIIGDWPEACTYSLTYKSASSNFPCHFCLVQKNDLIDTMQDQIILRNHENMMKHFNNNTGHSVSLEPVENYFWNIPNLNIYAATVPDRMYHLDLGLYHYQIEFTKGILGRSSIDKMNERIGAIPRYPGLKIFSKGLQSIARLTTSEHRDLMKVIVFVVDGLLSNDLSEVYVKWNKMYILNRLEIFKESDLEKFQKAINEWADLFVILFRKKSDSKMKFPKFHSWIFHIVDTIREYGAINGYTTETYESLHKSYVKTPYRLSNKKGIEEQIMKTIRRKAIIKRRITEELHKTPTALIYTSKLFEFKLLEASIFFEQQKKNPDLTENMIKDNTNNSCNDNFNYISRRELPLNSLLKRTELDSFEVIQNGDGLALRR
ncbi:hypothetical protein Glove_547g1 [Diversispora epigaea]|uniref:Uncharacterized protein n=1 Tax=Diversispora epigaea TaxID=1348612 RepID=A0A397GBY3_9GLOM|nr:hypothetical protein Glove_547g1 [Diversispora epigaea]